MKKVLVYFLLLLITRFGFSQEKVKDSTFIATENAFVVQDTTKYVKSINYTKQRNYKENLKQKYNNKDFIYVEEEIKEQKPSTPPNLKFLKIIASFLQTIFPFLLGGFVVFIILKLVLGAELNFFNFKKGNKKVAEKLIYEEDDIHEIDLENLLKNAIENTNYRLAIRYHYLLILKDLSSKKLIDYHKDKTNTEYKFELEKGEVRDAFSYLSYIYTYVWYGEFSIEATDFYQVQAKYVSFKTLTK